jgi:hypothetical protein
MSRALVQYSPVDRHYRVLDTRYNHLVLFTSNYGVADYWRRRVNGCEHDVPYDILDHDRRVLMQPVYTSPKK